METQKYFVKQLSLKGAYNGNRYFNADFYYDLKRVISVSGMPEGGVLIAFPARQKNGSLSAEDLTACLDGLCDMWVVGRFIHTMRRQIGDTVFNADSLSVNISEVSIENALQTAAKICERLSQSCAFLKRCVTSELYVIRRYDAKSESTDGKKLKTKKGVITMDLKDVSTKELVEELAKREGVEQIGVAPYEPYSITANGQTISDGGPVVILRVWD